MNCFINAGNKIRMLFIAQVISVVSIAVSFVPVLSSFSLFVKGASLFLLIVSLYSTGLGYKKFACADIYSSSAIPKHFKNALILSVVYVLTILFSHILSRSQLHIRTPLPAVITALPICITYLVLEGTAEVLVETGDDDKANAMPLFWRFYSICMTAAVVCTIFTLIPMFGGYVRTFYAASKITETLASLIYLAFLYSAVSSIVGWPWE